MHNWSDELSQLLSLHGLFSLLTLSLLEIILGIDNIIFISLAVNKLPTRFRDRARRIGLLLALLVRSAMLFGIGWIAGLKTPFFYLGAYGMTAKALILLGGGLFLVLKTWKELRTRLVRRLPGHTPQNRLKDSVRGVIVQIILIDFIFSFDSILAAVGLAGIILIMVGAVVGSMGLMLIFSGKVAAYMNKHPGIKMIALLFLIVIGGILVAEGLTDVYNTAQPSSGQIHINKNYAYVALGFALLAEFCNIRTRKVRRLEEEQA